ncbi:hypothetical protein CBR_g41799 [Chara braunii]|uniref:Uncharacterized protein n=1 Tax=Chara braunii TaxID=69332 RepID=A0A388LWN4_CHABU|nr:hypothetical protein CBR_g41799 [Chara braunii]|eukprot:GBG86734.1 hypothetical protein CBR_g41799 [Chara braunii]
MAQGSDNPGYCYGGGCKLEISQARKLRRICGLSNADDDDPPGTRRSSRSCSAQSRRCRDRVSRLGMELGLGLGLPTLLLQLLLLLSMLDRPSLLPPPPPPPPPPPHQQQPSRSAWWYIWYQWRHGWSWAEGRGGGGEGRWREESQPQELHRRESTHRIYGGLASAAVLVQPEQQFNNTIISIPPGECLFFPVTIPANTSVVVIIRPRQYPGTFALRIFLMDVVKPSKDRISCLPEEIPDRARRNTTVADFCCAINEPGLEGDLGLEAGSSVEYVISSKIPCMKVNMTLLLQFATEWRDKSGIVHGRTAEDVGQVGEGEGEAGGETGGGGGGGGAGGGGGGEGGGNGENGTGESVRTAPKFLITISQTPSNDSDKCLMVSSAESRFRHHRRRAIGRLSQAPPVYSDDTRPWRWWSFFSDVIANWWWPLCTIAWILLVTSSSP